MSQDTTKGSWWKTLRDFEPASTGDNLIGDFACALGAYVFGGELRGFLREDISFSFATYQNMKRNLSCSTTILLKFSRTNVDNIRFSGGTIW